MLTSTSANKFKGFILEYDNGQCLPKCFQIDTHSLLSQLSEWHPTLHECYGRLIPYRKKCDAADGNRFWYEDATVLERILGTLVEVVAGQIPEQIKQRFGLDSHYPQLSRIQLFAMLVGEGFPTCFHRMSPASEGEEIGVGWLAMLFCSRQAKE